MKASRRVWHSIALTVWSGGALSCAGDGRPPEAATRASQPNASQESVAFHDSGVHGASEETAPKESAPRKDRVASSGHAPEPPAKPALFQGASFPPPAPGPVHEATADPDDGTWQSWPGGERIGDEMTVVWQRDQPPMVKTVLHPHPRSKWQTVTVAAFDQRHIRFSHRPGTKDVKDTHHEELLDRAGLVPKEDRDRLVAVFNGGFQPRHGWWGMRTLGTQVVEPRPDGCTVYVTKGGAIGISPHRELNEVDQIPAYRQAPPCLVAAGALHPKLLSGSDRVWGGNHPDRKTRRRSAVGVSQDGRTLYYALGSETEPKRLAEALLAAGAHAAAQLDINWNWTRLFSFGLKDGEGKEDQQVVPITSLVEQMNKDRGEYVYRPSGRGFFYAVLRSTDS